LSQQLRAFTPQDGDFAVSDSPYERIVDVRVFMSELIAKVHTCLACVIDANNPGAFRDRQFTASPMMVNSRARHAA